MPTPTDSTRECSTSCPPPSTALTLRCPGSGSPTRQGATAGVRSRHLAHYGRSASSPRRGCHLTTDPIQRRQRRGRTPHPLSQSISLLTVHEGESPRPEREEGRKIIL